MRYKDLFSALVFMAVGYSPFDQDFDLGMRRLCQFTYLPNNLYKQVPRSSLTSTYDTIRCHE